MLDGLLGAIAVRLIRKEYQPHCTAVAANRFIHALGLDRERSGVVISLAMDQQNGSLDFVSKHKWRHTQISILRFPERTPLALESERSQRTVISATLGDTGAEQVAMGQQIRGHERAVAVTAHAHAVRIDHTHFGGLVDGCLGIRHDLLHIGVVHNVDGPHYGHGYIFEYGIAIQ